MGGRRAFAGHHAAYDVHVLCIALRPVSAHGHEDTAGERLDEVVPDLTPSRGTSRTRPRVVHVSRGTERQWQGTGWKCENTGEMEQTKAPTISYVEGVAGCSKISCVLGTKHYFAIPFREINSMF